MPYVTLDSEGRPTGFYHDAHHGPRQMFSHIDEATGGDIFVANPETRIPPEAISISDTIFSQWRHRTHSHALRDGKLVEIGQAPMSAQDVKLLAASILAKTAARIAEDEPDRERWLAYRGQIREIRDSGVMPSAGWPERPA